MNSNPADQTPEERSLLINSITLLLALLSFATGFYIIMELYYAGFPDGHLTEYERATALPLKLLAGGFGFAGLYASFLSFRKRARKSRLAGLLLAALLIVALVLIMTAVVPWYYGTHLGLDTGHGG